jgi:hypothetical protein
LPSENESSLIPRERLRRAALLNSLERRGYRELVISLAQKLYHRERGVSAPSEEALVGTYLKSLPDDGSADLADEMTPTVK